MVPGETYEKNHATGTFFNLLLADNFEITLHIILDHLVHVFFVHREEKKQCHNNERKNKYFRKIFVCTSIHTDVKAS